LIYHVANNRFVQAFSSIVKMSTESFYKFRVAIAMDKLRFKIIGVNDPQTLT
jgi:hypothetical protein